MRHVFGFVFAPLIGLLSAACASSTNGGAPSDDEPKGFDALAESVYWELHDQSPAAGVELGYHKYDGLLPDIRPEAIAGQVTKAKRELARFEAIDPATLDDRQRVDRQILITVLRREIFGADTLRSPWRNPMMYANALSVSSYISRDYAPLEERAKGIIGIAKGTRAYLKQARENVQPKVPKPWIQVALLQTNGSLTFVGKGGDVRNAMSGLAPESSKALNDALDEMVAALEEHKKYLEGLLPQATDDFALGEEKFLAMLEETQGIDLPLSKLQEVADADLERNLAAMVAAAKRIDPKKSVQEVVQMVAEEKPAPDKVLDVATEQCESLRRFLIDKKVASIPSEDVAKVTETPPFMRYNFAFLDGAGPFERKPLPSFYYISPPDPEWPEAEQRAYIPSGADLLFVSVHEVWPGHFLHGLHLKKNPSKIQKSFWNYVMGEGWAHYTEEMMFRAGVGADDPKIEVGMLLNALLRNVRFVSTIGMHTKGMTVAQVEQLFKDKAFQDPGNARQQAIRGTFDPMYLAYTIGKLMIIKLREDWKAKMGEAYSLQAFHDAFLSYGAAPIPVIRKEMLGPDAGPPL